MRDKHHYTQKGQSLVEVAIFLPVALIIIAGLVELSLYLVTQNKVNTAAREAARFGAAGGEDAGMVTVALNTVTQTLQLEIDEWDLWSVRGRVRAQCVSGSVILDYGPNDQDFRVVHSYGISQTVAFTETNDYVFSEQFKDDVLDQLSQGGVGDCSTPSNPAPNINGLEFVAMYAAHDVQSILGLDVFLENVFTVRALHVFRITSVVSNDQTEGCDAFPIALHEELRSVRADGATGYNVALGTNVNQRYPSSLPTYASFLQDGHLPDHPLKDGAQEGDVFLFIGEGHNPAELNYAWLQWSVCTSGPGCNQGHIRLQESMTWPGNSTDPNLGFHEAGNWDDTELHIGDRVVYSVAEGTAVSSQAGQHIDRSRTLRVILWREDGVIQGGGPGNSDVNYIRVTRFANVRLLGYHFTGNRDDRWLLVQFVSYDDSCGQVADTP